MRTNILTRQEFIEIQRGPSLIRLDRPSNLLRARALGYRAIQGMVVLRGRIRKGTFRKPAIGAIGRRPARTGITRIVLRTNNQELLERRVLRRYPNMVLLGSYQIYQNGQHRWYEMILIDSAHPAIQARQGYTNLITSPGARTRQNRGLTTAGRRSRGL